MLRTVADYFDEKGFLTTGMRKIQGRYYYPIESSYYSDGLSVSREYICGSDFLEKKHCMFWAPIYLMTWDLDADPERNSVSRLEKDPYRNYNISYHVECNQIEYSPNATTFEWTTSGWRMKDPDGEYWTLAIGSELHRDRESFAEHGYLPSMGEYQAQCELEVEYRKIEQFVTQLTRKNIAFQNHSHSTILTDDRFGEATRAVYALSEEADPVFCKHLRCLYARFDLTNTQMEVLSMLRLIRESCSSFEQYEKLFHDKRQVSAEDLTEFTRIMSLDM